MSGLYWLQMARLAPYSPKSHASRTGGVPRRYRALLAMSHDPSVRWRVRRTSSALQVSPNVRP